MTGAPVFGNCEVCHLDVRLGEGFATCPDCGGPLVMVAPPQTPPPAPIGDAGDTDWDDLPEALAPDVHPDDEGSPGD